MDTAFLLQDRIAGSNCCIETRLSSKKTLSAKSLKVENCKGRKKGGGEWGSKNSIKTRQQQTVMARKEGVRIDLIAQKLGVRCCRDKM